jgi:FkbM family methyltransferase
VKQLATALIRYLVFHAPWGVREAMLQACIDRIGPVEVGSRLFPKLKVVEIGATGDRGVVTSAWNDHFVLPEYAETGTFAEVVTAALTDFFGADGGTYMDVGANIGLTTIPLARNPRVQCLAFEPEPLNFGFLQRNVARNAPGGMVDFHQVALFNERGSMSLSIADANIGDHRLTKAGVPGRRSIEIPTVPLDDFVDRISGKLAIKIDTQGAEPFVIAGGQKVLAKAGLLAMEFCPFLMKQLGGDPDVVIAAMSGFDRIAVMTGGKAETPNFVSTETAQTILRDKLRTAEASDGDYVDIMAVRADTVTAPSIR